MLRTILLLLSMVKLDFVVYFLKFVQSGVNKLFQAVLVLVYSLLSSPSMAM